MKLSGRGQLVCLYASNAMVYAFNALFYCFLPIYFNAAYSPVEAGILLSVGPAVSIAAPLFWGMIADHAKYKNTVLIFAVLASAAAFFLLKFEYSFLAMAFLVGVTMLFMSPFPGLIDAITLEHTEAAHTAYGPIRVMGTFGFGLISLVSSFFTGNNINVIFYIFAGMALLCSLALFFGPQVEGHARKESGETKPDAAGSAERKKNAGIGALFSCRHLMLMILFMLVVQFAYSFYINYFPTYLTETLCLPQWTWGLTVLLTVLGEIPFFFFYNKLFDRFGIRTMMTFVMIGSVVRYVLLGVFRSAFALLLINALTGFIITIVTYCAATYITRYIAPELQATGQNLLYCIGQSVARVLGGVLGGVIQTKLGTPNGMLLCAGILLLFTVVYFITFGFDPSPRLAPFAPKKNK